MKSACEEAAKKEGAMYYLMGETINAAKEDYRTFDFGGSNVNSVREFYCKFGAVDRYYYEYQIGKAPGWFQTAKSIFQKVKSK